MARRRVPSSPPTHTLDNHSIHGFWVRFLPEELRNRLPQTRSVYSQRLDEQDLFEGASKPPGLRHEWTRECIWYITEDANHYRHPKLVVGGSIPRGPNIVPVNPLRSTPSIGSLILYTQAIFGKVYSDRYFPKLYLQNLRAELLLVMRAPIESLLSEVRRNSPVYHKLTPAHLAATIQGHARRLGIDKLIAAKDKDTHLVRNLSEGHDTD
jgi:hypothetical protein